MKNIKPYLRWVILGGTLFFLLKAFKDNWGEVAAVRIDERGWLMLAIALFFTLLAHIWSGWVWTWILQGFKQPVGKFWAIQVYLKTNIAKYLPGNVWHFYGRISAISSAGGSVGVASIIVLLEPIFMATAALVIALFSNSLGWINTASNPEIFALQIFAVVIVLLLIHPFILNRVIHLLSRVKGNANSTKNLEIESYPLLPLLGELVFLLLRGTGFLYSLLALMPVNLGQIPQLLSAFSFAWLLGLIVPGAPGGLGVFEATAIALLDEQFSGVIILCVALFRLVSILAEAIAAGLACFPLGSGKGK